MRSQNRQGLMKPVRHAAFLLALIVTASMVPALVSFAEDPTATLREAEISVNKEAPRMGRITNNDLRQARNYPEQPPLIPHKIRGYQVDKNSNRCLTCHSRSAVEQSQAPMISVTHYMDRDNQVRATVSARRYFCNQCHVPQTDAKPLVENTFVDVDTLLNR
ncbi:MULTISPECIES: nitrate reductase cytochrome c-type subunit [Nisaea]|uniref:nitrate reductase cytochrome c-type subunit n=1 Tax=Nisaea TaxID=390876 RepID=UPI000424B724|nr:MULTISPECIES: nitrate reductase cytochrome c-type subunit [Nisaea]